MNKRRKWTIVLMTITIFAATAAFLPEPVLAGDLEPSAPPGSTMKTLEEVSPTWSQKLPASERFELVLPIIEVSGGVKITVYKAMLDKETGLVWERFPDTTKRDWVAACAHCYRKEVGGRKGWRLPTVEELASLVDTTSTSPALPTGYPFPNVQSSYYWSSSTHASSTGNAWLVYFNSGFVNDGDKGTDLYVWCVRGDHGHDAY
jgi:hypothetical protein